MMGLHYTSSQTAHKYLKDLKGLVRTKAKKITPPSVHIKDYPAHPRDLGEAFIAASYHADDLPDESADPVEDTQHGTIVPLRKNSKLLVPATNELESSAALPAQSSSSQLVVPHVPHVPHLPHTGMAQPQPFNPMAFVQAVQTMQAMGFCHPQIQQQMGQFMEPGQPIAGLRVFGAGRQAPAGPASAARVNTPQIVPAQQGDSQTTDADEVAGEQPLPLQAPRQAAPALKVPTPEMTAQEQASVLEAAIVQRQAAKAEATAKAKAKAAAKGKAKAKAKGQPKAKGHPKAKAAAKAAPVEEPEAKSKAKAPHEPEAPSYCKMFYGKTNKAAIRRKHGGQICQFGAKRHCREKLFEIADKAIEQMVSGALAEAACKEFCENEATALE